MLSKEQRIENLKKANEQSHAMIVKCLREALYKLLEKKSIDEIKVVDLVQAAGVSRGGFYRNFYRITDVLEDDIKAVAADVRAAVGKNISLDWQIILQTIYQHRKKIPLLLKAGMGMEILRYINLSVETVDDSHKLRIAAWNGVIFNSLLFWAEQGFREAPDQLAKRLAEITQSLYTIEAADSFDQGLPV